MNVARTHRDRRFLLGSITAVVVASIVGLFLFRALDRYAGAGHDDTFIALLAGEQVGSGEGFVSADGAPGEIGSSLLHVLVLAGLKLVGAGDLYLANKAVGLLAGAAAVGVILCGRRRFFGSSGPLSLGVAVIAAMVPVALPTYLFWTLGGLETGIVALLLTLLGLVLSRRSAVAVAIVACLLVLARPEGFVYLGAVAAFGFFARPSRRWWGIALGVPAGMFALLTSVRILKFGAPMPLPVMAKVASLDRVGDGVRYVAAFASASILEALLVLGLVATIGHAVWQRGRVRGLGVLAIVTVHFGAVAISGGDWMAFHRFLAPVVPLLGVIIGRLVWILVRRAPRWTPVFVACAAMLWLAFGANEPSRLQAPYLPIQESLADLGNPDLGTTLGERVRLLNGSYRRDALQLDPFLRGPLGDVLANVQPRLVVATYQMGFFPYRLHELDVRGVQLVDTVGIVDSKLSRLPGVRTPRGLAAGIEPQSFLDPASTNPVPQAVLARHPDVVYVLAADPKTVKQLYDWGWVLMWNAPQTKIFVRMDLARRIEAITSPQR